MARKNFFIKTGFYQKNKYDTVSIHYFSKKFKKMNKYHRLILAFLAFAIFSLIYKIIVFQIQKFQVENFSDALVKQNLEIAERTALKENLEKYISTNAYRTQVAKASQNKSMPGETVINVVSQEDVNGNADLDTQDIYAENSAKREDPTAKMSNPERWQYLFQNGLNKLPK